MAKFFFIMMKKPSKLFAIGIVLIVAAFVFSGNKDSFAEETDWQTLPQVHIKARFLAFTNDFPELQDFLNLTNSYQVLTDTNFQKLRHSTEVHENCEIIGEPEVTAVSSRTIQLRATSVRGVVSRGIAAKALKYPGVETADAIWNRSSADGVEIGPILDATPLVMTNGFTIKLNLEPGDIETIGSGDNLRNDFYLPEFWKTNYVEVYVRGEKQKISHVVPDYRFQTNQINVPAIYLYDNQTVILKGLDYVDASNGPTKKLNKHLLLFVTATVVDPAGNRINSDEEMPFARDAIPPQM